MIPNYSFCGLNLLLKKQQTLSLHDLCLKVLNVHGTELVMFLGQDNPPPPYSYLKHHAPNIAGIYNSLVLTYNK